MCYNEEFIDPDSGDQNLLTHLQPILKIFTFSIRWDRTFKLQIYHGQTNLSHFGKSQTNVAKIDFTLNFCTGVHLTKRLVNIILKVIVDTKKNHFTPSQAF